MSIEEDVPFTEMRSRVVGLTLFLATAALVPSAKALGPPCAVHITAPGSTYVLTEDRSCAGSALIVDAGHVTIDLNGFDLTGNGGTNPNSSAGTGIDNSAHHKGVKIVNKGLTISYIKSFYVGIETGGDGSEVKNVRTDLNRDGIRVVGGDDVLLRANAAFSNTNTGISILNGRRTIVSHNTVQSTFVVGIYVDVDQAKKTNIFRNDVLDSGSTIAINAGGGSTIGHDNDAGGDSCYPHKLCA